MHVNEGRDTLLFSLLLSPFRVPGDKGCFRSFQTLGRRGMQILIRCKSAQLC